MVYKGLILAFLIFLVDCIFYGYYIFLHGIDAEEKSKLIEKLKYSLPIGLFMQIFFAQIFVFTFRFLAIFKALEPSLGGGLYFAYILFLPILYMLFNNWLWLETKKGTTFLNIITWGVKLALLGILVPLMN